MAVNSETGVIPRWRRSPRSPAPRGPRDDRRHAGPGQDPHRRGRLGRGPPRCSAHKMYGPKGVGALYRRLRGRASGWPAARRRRARGRPPERHAQRARHRGVGPGGGARRQRGSGGGGPAGALRDRLEEALLAAIPGAYANGAAASRVAKPRASPSPAPGCGRLPADARRRRLTGSACQTTSAPPSHVLSAMGLPDDDAFSTLRLSLGRFTTEDEVERAIAEVVAAVRPPR
jgi:cysteine desulfurase